MQNWVFFGVKSSKFLWKIVIHQDYYFCCHDWHRFESYWSVCAIAELSLSQQKNENFHMLRAKSAKMWLWKYLWLLSHKCHVMERQCHRKSMLIVCTFKVKVISFLRHPLFSHHKNRFYFSFHLISYLIHTYARKSLHIIANLPNGTTHTQSHTYH